MILRAGPTRCWNRSRCSWPRCGRIPAGFPDARAIVKRSGFGATRLFELFRQHYHTTPADLLLRARLDAVKQKLLAGNAGLATIAYGAGFESLSALHENFRRLNGLTPANYRELRKGGRAFEITLPDGFHMGYLRRALSRDVHSTSERFENDVYTSAVLLDGAPAMLELRLSPGRVHVSANAGSLPAAHALVAGILGLDQDAAAFARLAKRLGLSRLVAGKSGLRISQTHSVFEGLLWSIIGQQINFTFACLLKSRLVKLAGTPMPGGLYAPPAAAALAALDPGGLAAFAILTAEGGLRHCDSAAHRGGKTRSRGPPLRVRHARGAHFAGRARPRPMVGELPDDARARFLPIACRSATRA